MSERIWRLEEILQLLPEEQVLLLLDEYARLNPVDNAQLEHDGAMEYVRSRLGGNDEEPGIIIGLQQKYLVSPTRWADDYPVRITADGRIKVRELAEFLRALQSEVERPHPRQLPYPTLLTMYTALDNVSEVMRALVENVQGAFALAGGVITPSPRPQSRSARRDSGHYVYSFEKRKEIVDAYRKAQDSGEVANIDAWAKSHYLITGKTLRKYLKEFP